jgi:hypothetical protein
LTMAARSVSTKRLFPFAIFPSLVSYFCSEIRMRLATASSLVFCLGAGLLLLGCGKSSPAAGPKTVPFKGKLVFTKGGDAKSIFNRQGRIELESVDQPGVHALGAIEEDGSFTVATITSEGSSPGAVPGAHRVRLDLEDNAQRLVAPKFLDFAKSGLKISVPSEQPIEVQVWR